VGPKLGPADGVDVGEVVGAGVGGIGVGGATVLVGGTGVGGIGVGGATVLVGGTRVGGTGVGGTGVGGVTVGGTGVGGTGVGGTGVGGVSISIPVVVTPAFCTLAPAVFIKASLTSLLLTFRIVFVHTHREMCKQSRISPKVEILLPFQIFLFGIVLVDYPRQLGSTNPVQLPSRQSIRPLPRIRHYPLLLDVALSVVCTNQQVSSFYSQTSFSQRSPKTSLSQRCFGLAI